MRAGTILGVKELQNESSTQPPMLKTDSKATMEMSITNITLATKKRI